MQITIWRFCRNWRCQSARCRFFRPGRLGQEVAAVGLDELDVIERDVAAAPASVDRFNFDLKFVRKCIYEEMALNFFEQNRNSHMEKQIMVKLSS